MVRSEHGWGGSAGCGEADSSTSRCSRRDDRRANTNQPGHRHMESAGIRWPEQDMESHLERLTETRLASCRLHRRSHQSGVMLLRCKRFAGRRQPCGFYSSSWETSGASSCQTSPKATRETTSASHSSTTPIASNRRAWWVSGCCLDGAAVRQFARTPYAAGFLRGMTEFILTTVHVVWGDDRKNMCRHVGGFATTERRTRGRLGRAFRHRYARIRHFSALHSVTEESAFDRCPSRDAKFVEPNRHLRKATQRQLAVVAYR